MSNLKLKSLLNASGDFSCGICKEILKEPQQTSCCGSHFCRQCVEGRLGDDKNDKNDCPECKAQNISYFRDISFEKQIKLSPVACTQSGCSWSGEYGNLETHLKDQCNFVMVKCDYCDVGCPVSLPKADMQAHLREFCSDHLQFTYTFMMEKLTTLQQHVDQTRLESEVSSIKGEVQVHGQLLKSLQSKVEDLDNRIMVHKLLPYKIVIRNIDQYIHGSPGEEWQSPEFYTGTQDSKGYKMQLRVVPNSVSLTRNKEKALSARLFITNCHYDDKVVWPFHAKFTLVITDPSGVEKPYEVTARHTWKSPDDESCMRFQACIAHKDLIKYAKHDGCIHILVT